MSWPLALEVVKMLEHAMYKRVDEHAVGALVAVVDRSTRCGRVEREGSSGEIEKSGQLRR